jgi:hypothetical protein
LEIYFLEVGSRLYMKKMLKMKTPASIEKAPV